MYDVGILNKFSILYNELKNKNRKLSDIKINICENMEISKTSYYRILRECREKKFIHDTYQENMRNFLNTITGKKSSEHNGYITTELLLKWIDEFLVNYEKDLNKEKIDINNPVQKIICISIEQLKDLAQDFFSLK